MREFRRHTGIVAPLDRANIDTDQIIPKQFLKRIERSGFGRFLFYDWSHSAHGTSDPAFVLNRPQFQDATILLVGRNFGCGSSREHAPWALEDWGFRAIVAPSFADIFASNCMKNGLLPVVLSEDHVKLMMDRVLEISGYRLTVDLEQSLVTDEYGFSAGFTIDQFQRYCLLNGLDDISLTLLHEAEISAYEQNRLTFHGTRQ